MGGGRAMAAGLQVGQSVAPVSAGDGSTRLPLDQALKRLEGRGPFMSKLVARLRAKSAAAATSSTVGGTPSRTPNTGVAGGLGLGRGFLGGLY